MPGKWNCDPKLEFVFRKRSESKFPGEANGNRIKISRINRKMWWMAKGGGGIGGYGGGSGSGSGGWGKTKGNF